jgi:hypothetical protein
MHTTHRSPSHNRPGIITTLAVLLALEGISEVTFGGIQAIITRKMPFPPQPLQSAVTDYLIRLLPSFVAQIVFSCLLGILLIILAWELSMLKPWSYWITLLVILPAWMIYDLSKTLILLLHSLPTTMFEDPSISSNATSFIIELAVFIFISRENIRNVFYLAQMNRKIGELSS